MADENNVRMLCLLLHGLFGSGHSNVALCLLQRACLAQALGGRVVYSMIEPPSICATVRTM